MGFPWLDKGLRNTDTGLPRNRTFLYKSTWQAVLSVSLEYLLEMDHVSWSGESMLDLSSRDRQKYVLRWSPWKTSLTNNWWVTCYEVCWGPVLLYSLGYWHYIEVWISSQHGISEMTTFSETEFLLIDRVTLVLYWRIMVITFIQNAVESTDGFTWD